MTVPITCYNCPHSAKTTVGNVPGFNREIYVCRHPMMGRNMGAWPEIRIDLAPPENCPLHAEQLAAPAPAPACATCRFYLVSKENNMIIYRGPHPAPVYHPGLYCRACIHADPNVDVKGACVHPLVPKANKNSGTRGSNDTECRQYRCKTSCATCRFYQARPGINAPDGTRTNDFGICRRRAPVSSENFPRVGGDFWCGEHEAKP